MTVEFDKAYVTLNGITYEHDQNNVTINNGIITKEIIIPERDILALSNSEHSIVAYVRDNVGNFSK